MKKLIILTTAIFLITAIFVSPIEAEGVTFTAGLYTGVANQHIEEHLYYDGRLSTDPSNPKSILEWETKPFYLAGLIFSSSYRNFTAEFDVSTALPSPEGKMMNSDYLNDGMKFSYAVNDTDLKSFWNAKIRFSYEFELPWKIKIQPGISANYEYMFMNAHNGRGWYGNSAYSSDGMDHPWNSGYAHYYPDGIKRLARIDYKTHRMILFAGLTFSKEFSKLNVFLSADISPFSYVYAYDLHHGINSFHTEDEIYSYLKVVSASAGFSLRMTSSVLMDINISVQNHPLVKGTDYWNNSRNTEKAAASFWSVTNTFGVKYLF